MVQVDLGVTTPLVYVPPIHDLASRNPDDDAPPPPPLTPLLPPPSPPVLYLSKTTGARSTLQTARVETREVFSPC